MNTDLPAAATDPDDFKWPWLINSMTVNALNYCAFSMCDDPDEDVAAPEIDRYKSKLIDCLWILFRVCGLLKKVILVTTGNSSV